MVSRVLDRSAWSMHPAHAGVKSPVRQAFWILYVGFFVAPLIAGIDKFFYLLTDWSQYLAPQIPTALGLSAVAFMHLVGVIEIAAALLVLLVPRIGGYVVMAWLCGIIVNLLMQGGHLDIALRDLGLALGALALARLSVAQESSTPQSSAAGG